MDNYEDDTIDRAIPRLFSEQFVAPDQQRFDFRFAAATHPGKVRPRNEDHFVVIRHSRSSEILLRNLHQDKLTLPDDEACCMAVADGIGGAAFGAEKESDVNNDRPGSMP